MPVELVRADLIPPNVHQYIIDALKYAPNAIKIYGAIRKILDERQNDDVAQVREKIARMSDTIETMGVEIDRLKTSKKWDAALADNEARDPGTDRFIEKGLNASLEMRVESKRRLVGRLLARRLQVNGDDEEILLSLAMDAIRNLTEPQLLAASAVRLVQNLGKPDVPFANRLESETWLERQYSETLNAFAAHPWSFTDLAFLQSAGALVTGHSRTSYLTTEEHIDDVGQWLAINGVGPYDQLTSDSGSPEWKARYRASFPTEVKLTTLASGKLFADDPDFETGRLDAMWLTPLGETLADLVLEQLRSPTRIRRRRRLRRYYIAPSPTRKKQKGSL